MSSNTKGFLFIVILVIIIVGGLIVMNNRQQDNSSGSSSENGTVAGASTNSDPNTAPVNNSLNPSNKDQTYISNLLKYMASNDMTMYGATWCSHCKTQKESFGAAVKDLKIVECDISTGDGQSDECKAVNYVDASDGKAYSGIQGYPTWIYQGKGYSGEKSIDELAQIVGFTDSGAATPSE
ncbi:hypothetical protein COT78_00210 [Candidatus Berkelbacteria bacterium CG10_big_fil_rev_8_21_14_0_10_43_13]|uniref:Thioredoxin domain-containing protein n=1 Tax=Candidatus Berkelbacteria bacterium CG10_big_fil_rev_8_21_14_0_10_43_13 TaxID=1974514 RepID=A0A2H0W7R2_9BACT|nr:MAG: hypothetical protein COT78_00210 [Candidatus Berkelbacteria bacterium CG10_big_fil_rev_8_21_14_0_10_43_13]